MNMVGRSFKSQTLLLWLQTETSEQQAMYKDTTSSVRVYAKVKREPEVQTTPKTSTTLQNLLENVSIFIILSIYISRQ